MVATASYPQRIRKPLQGFIKFNGLSSATAQKRCSWRASQQFVCLWRKDLSRRQVICVESSGFT
jgi:hypothetical protein